MAYWYSTSIEAERWFPCDGASTLDQAIEIARSQPGFDRGEPFVVAEAEKQSWRFDAFDRLDEEFDGANEELGDGDGDPPSIDAGICSHTDGMHTGLRKLLQETLEKWVRENGNPQAWSLLFSAYHEIPGTTEWHEAEQSGDSFPRPDALSVMKGRGE